MADMHFEQNCPCGSNVKMSGYESGIRSYIAEWHRTHDKHMNAIAKAVAEAKGKCPYPHYYWPNTSGGSTFTYSTGTGVATGDGTTGQAQG